MVQDVDAPDARSKLTERHGAVPQLLRYLVRDVHPDAYGEPFWRGALPAALAQDPGELAVVHEDIVGPLELRPRRSQELIHHIGDDEPDAERQGAEHWHRGTQQHREPHASQRRAPRAAVPPPPRRLLLPDDHGAAGGPPPAPAGGGARAG